MSTTRIIVLVCCLVIASSTDQTTKKEEMKMKADSMKNGTGLKTPGIKKAIVDMRSATTIGLGYTIGYVSPRQGRGVQFGEYGHGGAGGHGFILPVFNYDLGGLGIGTYGGQISQPYGYSHIVLGGQYGYPFGSSYYSRPYGSSYYSGLDGPGQQQVDIGSSYSGRGGYQ